MTGYDEIYQNALCEIDRISADIEESVGFDPNCIIIENSESTLDVADYCFTFLFGLLGAVISTNEKLEAYLADIHKAASEADGEYDKFQLLMGKVLHHKGDSIDRMSRRDGSPTYIMFHRLLWGHDPLSGGGDNPFRLMIAQEDSKIRGALQALRHLIADTMSKQGLPIPGSSVLDYVNEDGKTTNYIIDLANNLSIEAFDNKAMSQEIYSHLFTIRTQDIAGGVIAKVLTEVYFKARKIEDKLRKSQMLFMVYAINFFAEAVIGAVKQKGVPYVNIPVATSMIVSFAKFCYYDAKETRLLTKETERLTQISEEIIDMYEYHQALSIGCSSANELMCVLNRSDNNMGALLDFLEGDEE